MVEQGARCVRMLKTHLLLQDITKRYVSDYMTSTRKLRFDEKWISRVLDSFNNKSFAQGCILFPTT